MAWIILTLLLGMSFAQELELKEVIRDTLENNLEIKALKNELKSSEYEYKATRGHLFPNIKLEETFTRTDVPAYVLFTKLNQESITPTDFTPSNLNNPSAVNNFETKLSIELPIWMGGKLRAYKRAKEYMKKATRSSIERKKEEVVFNAYRTFMGASLARSAISVAEKNLEDAREHLRIAKKLHKVGMALLSDVLRAEVFVKRAEEKLTESKNKYEVAMSALELLANKEYEGYSVPELNSCPNLSYEELREEAIAKRKDLIAVSERIKVLKESYKAQIGDNLPQVSAFASYSLYDEDKPFGSSGSGYMVGLNISFKFNTGLSSIYKARSLKEKERAVTKRLEFLKKAIEFSLKKAYSEYKTSLSSLNSAKARLESAKEVVRILEKRYESGLARMVDLLDAQTQLENARFDYIKALYACNLSYGKALLEAGVIKEVLQ